MTELIAEVDVVLTSIGGDDPILTVELLERALASRWGRPLFVIDIGVPRNADPAINELDPIYLYDIDDLASLARKNANERQREGVLAEIIIEEQHQRFEGWLTALRAIPTIKHLRERVESIRVDELERALRRIPLDDDQREAVEALTKSIVNKILHAPVSKLRREAEHEEGIVYLEAARALFGLDDETSDEE